jgi:hypothetical protein
MDSIKKDFSAALMHCSTIAYFMQPGKEKTPKQLWEEASATLDTWIAKYNALDDRKKGMKSGENMLQKVHKWGLKSINWQKTRMRSPFLRPQRAI